MIGRVLKRGRRVAGLLYYLYSPGRPCRHTNPHLLVRLRHSPTQPVQVTGYAVSLPGMTHWDGQQL